MSKTKCANLQCNSTELQYILLGEGGNVIEVALAFFNPLTAPQVMYRVVSNNPFTRLFKETFTGKIDTSSAGRRLKCKTCGEKLIFCYCCKTTFSIDSYPPLAGMLRCKNCRAEIRMDSDLDQEVP